MTIDERIEKTTAEMNTLRQQIENLDRQSANIQQQRENAVHLYRRAEGALDVLRAIKNDGAPTEATS